MATLLIIALSCASSVFSQTRVDSAEPAIDADTPDVGKCLSSSQSITVYSLEPSWRETFNKEGKDIFHHCKILGQTTLPTARLADTVRAVQDGIGKGQPSRCVFDPHHGLSVDTSTHKVDIVICFFCGDVHCYKDGQFWCAQTVKGNHALIGELEKKLNAILTEARIPQSSGYKIGRKFHLRSGQ